jgi:hypothetical protein
MKFTDFKHPKSSKTQIPSFFATKFWDLTKEQLGMFLNIQSLGIFTGYDNKL